MIDSDINNYHERDPREEKKALYEEQYAAKAFVALSTICRIYTSDILTCLSFAYLDGAPDAVRVYEDLGLNERHAWAVVGNSEAFWSDVQENGI